MNRDDTIEAFVCCTQIPPDCTNCPEKGPTGELGRGCKSDVKTSVYHWLVVQEPVVRCSECKFGKLCIDADAHSLIQCTNTNYPTANVETWPLELDWYCAGGERRDGDA
jgi:hypothetical protein